jgi:hypothetical protein
VEVLQLTEKFNTNFNFQAKALRWEVSKWMPHWKAMLAMLPQPKVEKNPAKYNEDRLIIYTKPCRFIN